MFEIHKAQDEQYYVIAKAKNGEILMTSETYTKKYNAIKCVASIINNIADANTEDELIVDKSED